MDVEIESDVLVVGTGGAGLRASIEAHENGASVVAVSKAPAGMSNATMVAGGGFRAALEGLTPKEHFEDTLQVGNYLNDRRLLEVLTREGSIRVLELQRFGVEMRVTHARASITPLRPPSTGLGLTKPMVEYLRSKGVTLIENVILSKLLNTREGVIGAVGYDYRNDNPVLFSSKAIILATGGAGALYERTDCPLRTTGDGYSLAYHAGAKLRDMEFVQFVPFALAEPGFPALLMAMSFIEEGRILNRLGENIPEKHGITVRPLYTKARGPLSIAIMREIQAGNGVDNAVLLEAREPIIRLLEESQWYALHPYARIMEKIGALEKPFKIAPVCHFNMGGIMANEDGETAVPGLFGVGEVVGGIHGANRCGGNSLTDITVFGARVGATAAAYTDDRELKKINSLAEPELAKYRELRIRASGLSPRILMQRLTSLMWKKGGIIRKEHTLREAVSDIGELRELVPSLKVSNVREMREALEFSMALDASELIVRAALERKESRGAHFREDYPKEDKGWMKSVIIEKGNDGSMKLSTIPI